jgi:hypothetical protein
MNLRRRKPADSLYMLLDTMCNAFGGIILLAVLVVLLTSNERTQSKTSSDTNEMLRRRIAIAESDLQQALDLQATLRTKLGDERLKNQVALLDTRRQIQNEISNTREAAARDAKEIDAAASADPAERMQNLNAQLSAAQARKATAQNGLDASKENVKRLSSRLAALEQQAANLVNESQRQLRLPKEHETGKRVLYIIARYGRMYPCRNSDLSRNESDIEWTSTFASETAEPRLGKGIVPENAAALAGYFRNLPRETVYLVFCVYEDSFSAFITAKQRALQNGLAFGWEPFQAKDGPVSFGAVGHRPKPQ